MWTLISRLIGRPDLRMDDTSWRIDRLFQAHPHLFLAVEHDGRVIGGTIGMRLIAIEPWARGMGLGRRLWQTVEGEAASAGLGLGTHADPENKGFFLKLGYTDAGKSKRHMSKGVPLSPAIRAIRTRKWRERVGDLNAGMAIAPEPSTGAIPPLEW